MSRGIRWFKTGFLATFALFFAAVLLVLIVCALTHRGDAQLIVLFASLPSSLLAQGVAGGLHGSMGLSYPVAGFWEALAGGLFGAIQYGLLVGTLGFLASAVFGKFHDAS